MTIFDKILASRGLTGDSIDEFLSPSYDNEKADPFLLPDMHKAVDRLKAAHAKNEKIVIYGDYDVDGVSATALLLDAFESFGFRNVDYFIPSRFEEGYGMTIGAVDKVAKMKANLIVTVDCGSLCHDEIAYATSLGIDTIVTDHHNVADTPPPAIAAVNPRFNTNKYPFDALAGVGVAFKLVQALQQQMGGLKAGYEKWLLDLVALGTVCDLVRLTGENRANVFWGIEVMRRQHRPGIKAMAELASVSPSDISSRTLGFLFGPRINAAGRLETARHALDVLIASTKTDAENGARYIDDLNRRRRSEQDEIFKQVSETAEKYKEDKVLVISGHGWNHGIIGIVAAKILEKYKKPVYILEEGEQGEAKGSARSFGDFSAADAIRYAEDVIIRGGGHAAAAGVTLHNKNIDAFRRKVNEFYDKVVDRDQSEFLIPKADVEVVEIGYLNEDLVRDIAKLEPFGNANPEPILKLADCKVTRFRRMGDEGKHIKIGVRGQDCGEIDVLAFSAPKEWHVEIGENIDVWINLLINQWNGQRSVEGRILHLEKK